MKFNEKLLTKMRDKVPELLATGPLTATIAIQHALQNNLPLTLTPHFTQAASEPHPQHDINQLPQIEALVDVDTGVSTVPGMAGMANFVPQLLAGLGISSDFGTGHLGRPDLFPFNLTPPSFAPITPHPLDVDADTTGQFIAGTYSNQAGSRTYKLYIPSNYAGQALPLVVMLHGCTQNPDDFAAGTQMNVIAEQRQSFVVYPAQTQSANSSKCWNWFKAMDQQRGQGEPSIIAGITRQVMANHNINANQVYVAGMSAGGAMAVIMGTMYPDLYAAVGVHSGLPYASARDLPSALAAMRDGASAKPLHNGAHVGPNTSLNDIPIIVFHGDRDTTVHPRNGEEILAQNTPQTVVHGKIPHGHTYTQTTYQNAAGQPIAEHWLIHGATHAWSGGSQSGSFTDGKGPNASQEMMRFFATQARRPQ